MTAVPPVAGLRRSAPIFSGRIFETKVNVCHRVAFHFTIAFAELQCRWVDAYFPFTHPSFELEVKYDEEWIEMLGCGILRQDILKSGKS